MTGFQTVLLLVLCAWMLLGSYASLGRHVNEECNRTVWGASLAAVLIGLCAPNPWLGALIALLAVAVWRTPNPREELERALYPTLVWAGLYVALAPALTPAAVPVILGTMLAIGSLTGLWTLYSFSVTEETYSHVWRPFGYFRVRLAEYGGYHYFASGLGNPNHSTAVSAMSTSAGIGLLVLGYWWAAPFVLLASLLWIVMLRRGAHAGQPGASVAYVWTLCCGVASWWVGWLAWLVWAGVALTLLLVVWIKHPSYLSNRKAYWTFAWDWYRQFNLSTKLFGAGLSAWIRRLQTGTTFNHVATNPHNEGVAMLLESGAVGVFVLAGYVLTSGWRLLHDGPSGWAVLLVGAMVLTCAGLSSPWHKYLEIGVLDQRTGQVRVVGQGCPALNMLSFATVLCVEVLTR